MRVLLTGASSFTGLWFAETLHAAGAAIVAPVTRAVAEYDGVRGARVRHLNGFAEVVPQCRFGDERFLSVVRSGAFDALCHHAARVADYRSPDFDAPGAAAENTRNLHIVLAEMRGRGLKAVVATGTVFEPDEGIGNRPREAFSPYGLSKALTWQIMRYWCAQAGVPLGKFVVPNPFGRFEEPRFVTYLMKTWLAEATAEVRTPAYVRDNIHVNLLAAAYARFVQETVEREHGRRFGPCGYVETQGAFAERVAAELRPRLGLECRLRLSPQTEFAEPRIRANSDVIEPAGYAWSEAAAWDALAEYARGDLAPAL